MTTTQAEKNASEKKRPYFEDSSDGGRVIYLEAPINTHEGIVDTAVLARPSAGDFLEFGDPTALVYGAGQVLPADDMATIKAYAERLLKSPASFALISQQGTLGDGRVVASAVKSFFSGETSAGN